MRKKGLFFCVLLLLAFCGIAAPNLMVSGAASGLMIWYQNLLPTLLPFTILSNIFILSNYVQYFYYLTRPLKYLHIPFSQNGIFVLITGFLFGFPMGSKNCAELLKTNQITQREASILFIVSNHMSPVFVSGYLIYQQLHLPGLLMPSFAILYVPALLTGILLMQKKVSQQSDTFRNSKSSLTKAAPHIDFEIIDAAIMNGCETMVKLGCYIMIFSILSNFFALLPVSGTCKAIFLGIWEITRGIQAIAASPLTSGQKYVLAMTCTAFGGISGFAQTSSMIQGTSLSIKSYVVGKILLAGSTMCLSALLVYYFV